MLITLDLSNEPTEHADWYTQYKVMTCLSGDDILEITGWQMVCNIADPTSRVEMITRDLRELSSHPLLVGSSIQEVLAAHTLHLDEITADGFDFDENLYEEFEGGYEEPLPPTRFERVDVI